MRSVLEASFYLLLITVMCYLGIDFVQMNQKVSCVNEVQQYIKDYIEIYGESQSENVLDSDTLDAVREKAEENGMKFSCTYAGKTSQYVYYDFWLEYQLGTAFFKMKKTHVSKGFARTALTEGSTAS